MGREDSYWLCWLYLWFKVFHSLAVCNKTVQILNQNKQKKNLYEVVKKTHKHLWSIFHNSP